MKCPGCHYVRQDNETVPEWKCPNCGIAYNKHPDYSEPSQFKISVLYKSVPRDKQIKAKTIYVYIMSYRFDNEHLQCAFKDKEGLIVRLELVEELGEYSSEIFQVLNSSNGKLNKHQKHLIIDAILKKETLKEKEKKKEVTTKSMDEKKLFQKKFRHVINKLFDNVLPITAIIGVLLLIYIAMDFYLFRGGIGYVEGPDGNSVWNSSVVSNKKNTIYNSPVDSSKTTMNSVQVNPDSNQEHNLLFDSDGASGLLKILGQGGYHQDINGGLKLLTQSAEKGYKQSQYNLGVVYYMGYANYVDKKKALFWFIKAAENGDEKAQYNLGLMYFRGEGTVKNKGKALYWFKKSAGNGYTPSIEILATTNELNNTKVYIETPSNKLIYRKEDKNGVTVFSDRPD